MFEKFISNNQIESHKTQGDPSSTSVVETLFAECGGSTISKGLYRIHTHESSTNWSILLEKYFSQYAGQLILFGFDWMGRQLALDKKDKNSILMFDCATAESFKVEKNIEDFHNIDLVDDKENILSQTHFQEVLDSIKMDKIGYEDCIGYKIPLFLGGSELIENYERCNMEVYWEFQCQIFLQIKDLPPGTKVGSVTFKD